MSTRVTLTALAFAAALAAPSASAGTWGSFDASRLMSASDELTTSSSYSGFRAKITGAGETLAAPTSTLDAAYLSGMDVFFTGMMSGPLSASELSDLQAWVNAGGICITTCDDSNRTHTLSTLALFSIEAWPGGHSGLAFSFGPHALMVGVNDLPFSNNSDLYSNDFNLAWLCGNNWEETIAMANETSVGTGKALALATDDVWLDGAAGQATTFQDNVIAWAGAGGTGGCGTTASFSNYGTGTAGTNGVPPFSLQAPPVVGTTATMQIGNSSNANATTLLLIGLSQTNTPSLGGTLLVNPAIDVTFITPPGGVNLPAAIPNDPNLCGVTVFMQFLQQDAGAPAGVSFSEGLSLTLGD